MSFDKLFAAVAARKIAKNPALAENPKMARMAATYKRGMENRPSVGGPGDVDAMMGRSAPRRVAEGMKKGGKISAAEAVHKHERAKHKNQPLTKLAKGGSASKRADGCCSKGKTKGRFV